MTREELEAMFDEEGEFDGEFLAFNKIAVKSTNRPDLHAFILLDKLVSSEAHNLGYGHDMVQGAEHDEIFLDVDLDKLAAVITPEQVLELIRCGVRLWEGESLAMYV